MLLCLAGLAASGCQCGREGSGLSLTVELQNSSARCVIAGVQVGTVFHASPKGWCGQVRPTPFVVTQDGGISTTVLPMAGFDLAASSTLIISGTRPLIFAVYGPAAIHGVIDARSLDVARLGPGGNWSGCGLMNGGNATIAAGGGGAGFGTAGARGGGPGAGDAGLAGNSLLQPLTGGCRGGRGHDSSNRFEAPGGGGGGAVQISASGLLTVDGTISTSGAGGRGSTNITVDQNGGGGGGSGGAILLEAFQRAIGSGANLICNGGADRSATSILRWEARAALLPRVMGETGRPGLFHRPWVCRVRASSAAVEAGRAWA